MMTGHGLVQTIDNYTRHVVCAGQEHKSCIDLVFIRGHRDNTTTAVITHKIADHYMTAVNFTTTDSMTTDTHNQQTHRTRLNETIVRDKLDKVRWDDLLMIQDSRNTYLRIKQIITTIMVRNIGGPEVIRARCRIGLGSPGGRCLKNRLFCFPVHPVC